MGVRRESVELSLEDVGFSSTAAKDAAAIAAIRRELQLLDGTSVRANRSTSALGSPSGGIARTGAESRRASSDLNQFTGRLSLLATAGATLGPALLPIGAVAIPAVTSLASGLGVLVGGVGTAVLALHGLGDALDALDAYQLQPTDANLQKLHDTLGRLSPAAQDLVMRLDSLEPVVDRLRTISQDGWFPGVNEGLDEILTLLPDVERIVDRISGELGNLTADAGASLAGDADWEAFFHFIETDAVPTMDAFARATGNFIAGAGSILVAFQPLSGDFTDGLLDTSRAFREWAAGLSESDGFREFVDYVRENGPAVRDFFVALAQAIIGLAEAAAPWGAAVLPILTDAANVFATLADSPIGPVLYDAAAALLVFNKASSAFGTSIPRISTGISTTRTSLAGLKADLGTIATTWATAGAQTEREALRMSAAQERVRTTMGKLSGAAKMAAGAGGIIALTDGMSRAGTAAGTLETALGGAAIGFAAGGPWGAAVGGAIGLVVSLGQSHEKASEQVADLTSTFDVQTGAITENTRAMVAKDLQTRGLLDAAEQLGLATSVVTDAVLGNADAQERLNAAIANYGVDNSITSVEDLSKSYSDQEIATIQANRAATQLRDNLPGLTKAFGGQATDAKQLARALSHDYTGGAQIATASTQALAQAQQEARREARQTASSFTAFGDSLDDSKVSLREWINDMADQAKALRDFTKNAQTAARRGLRDGLIRELEAAGPAGAMRLKQLANASDTEIGRANKAWSNGRKAIRDYVNMKVPPKKVTVDTSQASSAIDAIKARLAALDGKRVTSYVDIVQRGQDARRQGQAEARRAGGGPVYGPGTGTSDSIPAWLSNGEYVIKAAAVAKYGVAMFDSLNAGRFANGGLAARRGVTRLEGRTSNDPATVAYIEAIAGGYFIELLNGAAFMVTREGLEGFKGWKQALAKMRDNLLDAGHISHMSAAEIRDLGRDVDDMSRKQLKRFASALDKASETISNRLNNATQARDSLTSTITGNLTGDIFGSAGGGSVFGQQFAAGSLGAANATLRQQIRDARQQEVLERQLRARGLSGPALQAVIEQGGIGALRSFAAGSNAELRDFQTLYGQRGTAVADAASTAADVLGLTSEIRRLTAIAAAIAAAQKAESREANRRHNESRRDRRRNADRTANGLHRSLNNSARNSRGR